MDLLTESQKGAIVVTERVASAVSIVGIFFILVTYLFSSSFDKPINRLIFFATWGNLGATVAALISENGPNAGPNSSLCQFQAFLVQIFLGVDALWSCCMAVNVYLIFFRAYTIEQLRALDYKYFVGCYGTSFIPALVYLFVKHKSRGRVYGEAIVIWQNRAKLQGFMNPFNENPFANTVTTEVTVTREDRSTFSLPTGIPNDTSNEGRDGFNPYSVEIAVGRQDKPSYPKATILHLRSLSRSAAQMDPNPDACLYARVAFLFFLALIVTWVPSSINRVYALAHPMQVNFGLNLSSSLVFPLQGFWNAVVYIITSRTACKKLIYRIRRGRTIPRQPAVTNSGKDDIEFANRLARRTSQRLDSDITSVTSLAGH
ncbi:MAG: hypothetical protein Q9187_004092 [Circinaria calcarea]